MKKEKRLLHSLPHGDIPASFSGCRIEILAEGGRARILVCGAKRIIEAQECGVLLTAGRERLFFRGKGLSCIALEGGILEIEGELAELLLGEGKGE